MLFRTTKMLRRKLYILNRKWAKIRLWAILVPLLAYFLLAVLLSVFGLGVLGPAFDYTIYALLVLAVFGFPIAFLFCLISMSLRRVVKKNDMKAYVNGENKKLDKAYVKFNFGAFGLTFVWGVYFANFLALLIFVPVVNVVVVIYLGLCGNKALYRKYAYKTPQDLIVEQKNWNTWGKILGVFNILFLLFTNLMYLQLLQF